MNGTRTTGEELTATDLVTYIRILTHQWAKTLTTLGFTLIPIFFILDVFMMPRELLPRFAVYRGATTALVIVQYLSLRNSRPGRFGFLHGYFFGFVVGLMIALMTTDLGGFSSTYYAGLNLVMMAVNLLIPWEFWHSAVNSLVIFALYLGLNFALGDAATLVPHILVNNLYFLFGTAVISVSINFVKQRLVTQEFFLRSDLKSARDALWGEMEVAKHIQTALLPKIHQVRDYQVAAVMVPATEVGGDYYDIIETEHGVTWACIGDVSGHGVESGLVMMMTQTSIYTAVNDRKDITPAQALHAVNAIIKQNISRLGADRYMTATTLRLEAGKITYAGKHQDILVHRHATGGVESLPTTGSWIGLVDELGQHLTDATATIGIGDTILLFTDGITEAMNQKGEMFGEPRLLQSLMRHAGSGVDALVAAIMRDVAEHMKNQHDDLTLVALRRVS